ncbi:MAG: sigma-70 family RNA polymerase sigma factor [Chloroflexi bacterium]|nr:sigma-70 family RNA polymerase sigma factor [Chloroflexota bacterium]
MNDSTITQMDDVTLLAALRRGDESAFATLVERHHASLVRLAMMYVPDQAAAEDVAQETWLGLLKGLDRFEGRSSLKTWLFTVLTNRAKTRGLRESRSTPFSALAKSELDTDEPSVASERFLPPDHSQWPDEWGTYVSAWDEIPEEKFLTGETMDVIRQAIAALPPAQREVITRRDIEGWPAQEVCNILAITETNQRVLLHRARSKVRQALEQYLNEGL